MTRLLLNILLAFAVLAPAAFAQQAPASRFDPGAGSRPQPKNPLDFLNHLNSKNLDVGQCIEDGRRIAVESSIREFSFWVNVATMGTLVGFFFWILQLKGERKQLLVSTAQVAAKYQNQLAAGHINYQRLHEAYRKYLDDMDREKEPKLGLRAPQPKGRNAGDQRETAGDLKAVPVAVMAALPDRPQAVNQPAGSDATFQSLRQQITALTQQLEQERQKNRKLRGE
jgi:hypothetical protein